ncbi:hypothetical protein, partial [Thermodesulfatator atlanticus]
PFFIKTFNQSDFPEKPIIYIFLGFQLFKMGHHDDGKGILALLKLIPSFSVIKKLYYWKLEFKLEIPIFHFVFIGSKRRRRVHFLRNYQKYKALLF